MTGEAVVLAEPATALSEDLTGRLARLFDTHHQRLFRLARRLSRTSEDAHDLVQETFLRAARAPHAIPDGTSHEEAWLVRVLVNICRDRWRKTAVRSRAVGYELPQEAPDNPEATAMARTMVWKALDILSPRRRAILVMYELEGAGIPAIAKLLGVTPVTVRWHLSRGRRELAKILGGKS